MPEKFITIEPFSPLSSSVIWHLNHLFWKHFNLWENTYGEHYEASLPSGVSESHKKEFVLNSADKFIVLLENLLKNAELPEIIYVLEQGPGSGQYARIFLDFVKNYSNKNSKPFYDQIHYLLFDTSEKILTSAVKNLVSHKTCIKTTTELDRYNGRILFIRHSNLWDQLPSKLFLSENKNLKELYVQPVLDERLEAQLQQIGSKRTVSEISQALQSRTIEHIILDEPLIWKPLVRALFLKTRYQTISKNDLKAMSYHKTLEELSILHSNQEFVFNDGALKNIEDLSHLIDWSRGGYAEIVDIVVPDTSGFDTSRRPKKYDGSLASFVNGSMLYIYAGQQNKYISFEKIRGLNHIVTMRERSLKAMLASGHFVTVAEIAASKNHTAKEIVKQAQDMLSRDIDVVAFSDQALVKSEYFKLPELLELNVFKHLPAGAIIPVLKARTKNKKETEVVTKKLQDQKIENLFVVTGDPSGEAVETSRTSLDVLPAVASYFLTGAVAHPQASDIQKTMTKIQAGAKFLIMQATYNDQEWDEWAAAIRKNQIHAKVPIIAVVMPVTSARMLKVVQDIKDVSVPNSFVRNFDDLKNDEFRVKGMAIAKATIDTYKKSGMYSGIYIYSKSAQTILELNQFIKESF